MKEIVSLLVLSFIIIVLLSSVLIAILVYYNKPMTFNKCKKACMSNCTTCKRNCDMRNKSVAIEEKYKNNKMVSLMLEKM